MLDQKYIDRFWTYVKVEGPNDCWTWIRAKTKQGHGYFNVKLNDRYQQIGAHKVSLMIQGITIPKGMVVMHKCDNPACVNPNHLQIGTYKDNTQDMINKGRGNPCKGERTWRCSVTEEIARKIKAEAIMLSRPGKTSYKTNFNELAKKYNVSRDAVSGIAKGQTWKHI